MTKRFLALFVCLLSLALAQTEIPPDATPFPNFAATPFPQILDHGIAAVQTQIDKQNANAAASATSACADWTANATRNRELGLAAPVKPVPQAKIVLYRQKDENQTTWLWERKEGAVAPPCADLPPAQPKPTGLVVAIGINLGGNWYQALPDDNAPDGYVHSRADGVYTKVRYPFGGWWLKK